MELSRHFFEKMVPGGIGRRRAQREAVDDAQRVS
jgi:hypothetical protein